MRVLTFLLCCTATLAHAGSDIEVSAPWARSTVRVQKTSSAYMTLKSARGATLLRASSPLAGSVELHEMKMDGDVMKMRAIPRLPLPAGKATSLTPAGYHLMLFELRAQLKPGESLPLRLEIDTAGRRETVDVTAQIRGPR